MCNAGAAESLLAAEAETEAAEGREREREKMIYRRWSLLITPPIIVGSIASVTLFYNFFLGGNVIPLLLPLFRFKTLDLFFICIMISISLFLVSFYSSMLWILSISRVKKNFFSVFDYLI